MAKQTTRDGIWITALSLARSDTKVTPEMIVESTDASERTARQTLNVMATTPFLNRELAPDGTVRFLRGDGIAEKLEEIET